MSQNKNMFAGNRARFAAILPPVLSLVSSLALAQGVPEPTLILYGTVHNLDRGNVRLTSGSLTWNFQRSDGQGPIVTISAPLTNINDQFSYIVRVPWETEVPGLSVSSNTLRLTSFPIAYNRSQVRLAAEGTNQLATFVQPAQTNLTVTSLDRGRIERVDLVISLPCADTDGNRLCDSWEWQYFGYIGVFPYEDPDGDGMTNFAEHQAGTHPLDPASRFAFIAVQAHAEGGVQVEWSSVQGIRYRLERSGDLLAGFQSVATNLPATAPRNAYYDPTATGPGPHFYRLRIEP